MKKNTLLLAFNKMQLNDPIKVHYIDYKSNICKQTFNGIV